jgi:capsular polysaccharide biosynthesis protein
MENVRPIHYGEIIKRDWRAVLVVTLVTILLAFIITLLQPFLYSSTVSVLVLQKSGFSIDAYSASKSEERIANKLAQVIYASSFLDKVLNSGFAIDRSYFQNDEQKKRDQWGKMVETSVPIGLSKLQVTVYHKDPNQAVQIAQAIAFILTSEKREYIGIDDVDLKVLDTPLASKYPVKPNIFLNIGLGVFLGVIMGVVYVIVTYNPRRDKFVDMSGPAITFVEPMYPVYEENRPTQKVEEDENDEEIKEEEVVEGGQPTAEEFFKRQ